MYRMFTWGHSVHQGCMCRSWRSPPVVSLYPLCLGHMCRGVGKVSVVIFVTYLWAFLGVSGVEFRDQLASFQLDYPSLLMPNFLANNRVKDLGFSTDVLAAQSYPPLCDPMDLSPPGSSVYRILQTKVLEWVAISYSRGSSQPRDRTQVSRITGRFFTN